MRLLLDQSPMNENVKNQIIEACHKLDLRKFVANHDGNISFRLSENECLATPTARAKGSLSAGDLLMVDLEGKVIQGNGRIFSEWIWHQAIYLEFPEVTAICHAHPPYATALGLSGEEVEFSSVPESIVSLGAPLRSTGWITEVKPSLTDIRILVREALLDAYAFYVPGNGVFAVGDDAEMSYLRVELLEQISKAHFLARQLGTIRRLPNVMIQELVSKKPVLKPTWKRSRDPLPMSEIDETLLLERVTEIIKQSL